MEKHSLNIQNAMRIQEFTDIKISAQEYEATELQTFAAIHYHKKQTPRILKAKNLTTKDMNPK